MFFLLSFALSSVEGDIISELKSIRSSLRDVRTILEAQRRREPKLPIIRPVIRPRLYNRLANNHILYYLNEPALDDSDPGTWGGPWPYRLANEPELSDPETWGGIWPTRLANEPESDFIPEKPRQLVPGLEFPGLPKRRLYNRAALWNNLFEIIPEDADEIAEEVEEEQIRKADNYLRVAEASHAPLLANSRKAQNKAKQTEGNILPVAHILMPPPSISRLELFDPDKKKSILN